MARKYFGTDGIRGLANGDKLTVRFNANASVDAVEQVITEAHRAAENSPELRVTSGRQVIELVPAVNWNKGYALRRILQMIPTILAVALLVFIIFSVVPGNFATSMTGGGRRVPSGRVARFGAFATEGTASMRGRMPIGRLRTCQPLSWKMR